jgi:uncharacterized protein YqjF (DUF2071 family)
MPHFPNHDFNYGVLEETAHRPWPLPVRPWVMTQTWHALLFAHWRFDPAALRARVPDAFDLDVFDGTAWIGVVHFYMTNVALRLVPSIPGVSAFPELNVRTYVTAGGKPGVYFLSLDAASTLAVRAARTLLNLPYYDATMTADVSEDGVRYSSAREPSSGPAARFEGSYRAIDAPAPPTPGSLEYFLTERYCLYALDRRARPYRLQIHHPPWPLQTAQAKVTVNTMVDPLHLSLPTDAPLLHYSRRQDMVAWMPEGV